MLDPQRKQAALNSRAKYQLREIENACREVTAMARHLNTLAVDIAASDLNTRKMEILKTEIKEKLKEYASSMDSIYQVFDRKIQLILLEIKRTEARSGPALQTEMCNKCQGLNAVNISKNSERQPSIDNQFSQTLNPRIAHLESKINEYQANQMRLKTRIAELQVKNEALLEEFNRLSTASNKKINELNSKISKEQIESLSHSPSNQNLSSQLSLQFSPTKQKKINPVHCEAQQPSHNFSYDSPNTSDQASREEKTRYLSFGCMPSRTSKASNSLRGSNIKDQCQKLDRNDRNRRFDLLINKLRDSQQESTDGSHTDELRRLDDHANYHHSPIRRHQI